jgi:hypothetical protein
MKSCPACRGRIPVRQLLKPSPYDCPHCGAALQFIPWRSAVANGLSLIVALWVMDALRPFLGRYGRLIAILPVYSLIGLLVWPFMMRLRVIAKPDGPLSIK